MIPFIKRPVKRQNYGDGPGCQGMLAGEDLTTEWQHQSISGGGGTLPYLDFSGGT